MYVDEQQLTWGYGPAAPDSAVASSAVASEPFRAGRYVILQHVGHGAMGNVYAAYDPDLDRKVAVKVLRDSTRGRPLPASLAREAKAMAKLIHPHVVTVFDVGHCERGVFVAMEYVEGLTLRTWLKQADRSWREVLAAFVQAGQGLAAAHAAGVIHHDFKPDNVLVSAGGVVKVADFGLARVAAGTAATVSGEIGDPTLTRSTSSTPGAASGSATPTHATERGPVGTLAYMAPERHLLGTADARSDQFSFCVALHEALYRERPFTGANLGALREAVLYGAPAEPPRGTLVPTRVAAVLRRGLARAPEDRFPTMDALVAALAEPAPRRRRWTLSAGLLLGAAGAMMAATRTGDPCAVVGATDDAAWGAQTTALRERFSGNAAVAGELDALAEIEARWVARRRGNCAADERLAADLRLARGACLDQRFAQMQATVAQARTADSAEDAAHQLAQVARQDDCDDLAALGEITPPTPEQAQEVQAGRAALAEVAALEVAGAYTAALAVLEPLERTAEGLAYPPLVAEVTYQRARLEHYHGASARARDSLGLAIDLAEAHRHDRLAADAWSFWVETAALSSAVPQDSVDAALRRATAAQARLQRSGHHDLAEILGEPELPAPGPRSDPQRVHPLLMQGLVQLRRKDMVAAERAFRGALADPALHPLTRAKLLVNRAMAIQDRVGDDEATRAWDEAVAAFRTATWSGHPAYALARIRRGEFLQWKAQFAAARVDFLAGAAALASDPASHAADLRIAHTGVALAELMAFRVGAATTAIQAAMRAGDGLPADKLLAQVSFEAHVLAGQAELARVAATREVALRSEAGQVFELGVVEGHLAEALAGLGDDPATRSQLAIALQHLAEAGMAEAEPSAYMRRTLGLLELRAGHEAGAEVALTRALELWQAEPCECRDAAEAQLGLVALYRRRGDPRAAELQTAADTYFLALGPEALAHRDRILATLH